MSTTRVKRVKVWQPLRRRDEVTHDQLRRDIARGYEYFMARREKPVASQQLPRAAHTGGQARTEAGAPARPRRRGTTSARQAARG